jgi:isopenicillin N synthase-like dioxygenase
MTLTGVVGGLEVFHRPTGTWHPVNPVKDAYVVNIGDMMGEYRGFGDTVLCRTSANPISERWTNDRYTSTLHRVISPVSDRDRYSIAFFNEGLLDQIIECIPTCIETGGKAKYEPVKVEEHLRKRYGNSY